MNRELVSKKTRNEFREFLVGWTLHEIQMEFEAANIDRDLSHAPQTGGQRRSLVEQFYHTLDFRDPTDVRKLLATYENILVAAEKRVPIHPDPALYQRAIVALVEWLRKDGLGYKDGSIKPITPEARTIFEETSSSLGISELTRRNIADAIQIDDLPWAGRLSENEFLSRIYDLGSLPSHDARFKTAAGDIHKHRVLNEDWPTDWVFTDSRFDLKNAPDEAYLRFLCEMLHPVVRPQEEDVAILLAIFNSHLKADGWEIAVRTHLSGRPIFAGRRKIMDGNPAISAVKPLVQELNAEYLTKQITRLEASVASDPELAIGTAKEFVETICKTILREYGESVSGTADLPQLVKQVRTKLKLLPEDISEKAAGTETVKRLLSNLGTIAQGLAELRGLYGSGHGKVAHIKGLEPRHARLAVGSACTLAIFLYETFQVRNSEEA